MILLPAWPPTNVYSNPSEQFCPYIRRGALDQAMAQRVAAIEMLTGWHGYMILAAGVLSAALLFGGTVALEMARPSGRGLPADRQHPGPPTSCPGTCALRPLAMLGPSGLRVMAGLARAAAALAGARDSTAVGTTWRGPEAAFVTLGHAARSWRGGRARLPGASGLSDSWLGRSDTTNPSHKAGRRYSRWWARSPVNQRRRGHPVIRQCVER